MSRPDTKNSPAQEGRRAGAAPPHGVPRPSTADDEAAIGTVIDGRYRLDALLGRGGMGSVYRAEHVAIRRTVAMKLLHPVLAGVPEVHRRFEREALAIGRIEHPNCVNVSDFGRLEDGSLYLVMELLEGQSLGDLLDRSGALPPVRALRILRHVLRGLEHAHQAGIVHRDVKPENVYLVTHQGDSDFAKILDFGIAKIVGVGESEGESGVKLTQAGVAFGTPIYMSPEQAVGNPVDARADLYAASVMAYEMIVGKPPFYSEDKLEVLSMHTSRPVPPMRELVPDIVVPPAVERLIRRGLTKRPEQRFSSAAEYIAAIDATLVEMAIGEDAKTHTGMTGSHPLASNPGGAALLAMPTGQVPLTTSGDGIVRPATGSLAAAAPPSSLDAALDAELDAALDGLATGSAPNRPGSLGVPVGPAYALSGSARPSGPSLLARAQSTGGARLSAASARLSTGGSRYAPGPIAGGYVSGQPDSLVARLRARAGALIEGPVDRARDWLADKPRWFLPAAGGVAGVTLIAIIGVLVLGGDAPPAAPPPSTIAETAAAKLEQGDPNAAIKELEANKDQIVEDPHAQLQLGHALSAKRSNGEAVAAYRRAIDLDAALIDDAALRANLTAIGDDNDGPAAIEALSLLITRGRDQAARDKLADKAGGDKELSTRHAAAARANELGLGDRVDWVKSYILDLVQLEDCKDRREAVSKLRALGDPRAIPPLQAAQSRKQKVGRKQKNVNACLVDAARAAVVYLQGLSAADKPPAPTP
jgi:protein kinase-like protein/PBS lyase HEAT-like repeat-containing protein